MATQKILVVGNWKANPMTLDRAKKLFIDIRKNVRSIDEVETVVAAPFPYIEAMNKLSPSGRIGIGAQDVFYEMGGAFTGEVSLSMLQSIGVAYVIVGHSERRALGETNDDVAKKCMLPLKHKLTTIVCVGEKKRDNKGDYLNFVRQQVQSVLNAVEKNQLKNLVLAYEPIWAIGTGKTATPQDALEMKIFIQKVVSDTLGRAMVSKLRIIYGGSVKKHNAEALLKEGEVDGFLVGGASLVADEFSSIVKIVKESSKK